MRSDWTGWGLGCLAGLMIPVALGQTATVIGPVVATSLSDGTYAMRQEMSVSLTYPDPATDWIYAPPADFAGTSLTLQLPQAPVGAEYMVEVELFLRMRVRLEATLVASTEELQTFDLRASGNGSWLLPTASGNVPVSSTEQLVQLLNQSVSGGTGVTLAGASEWSTESYFKDGDPNLPGDPTAGLFGGGGTVGIGFSPSMTEGGSGVGFHNLTDIGTSSPYVFITNPKVTSMAGASGYLFETEIRAVYLYVPEAGVWASGWLMLVAMLGWRTRRRWLVRLGRSSR